MKEETGAGAASDGAQGQDEVEKMWGFVRLARRVWRLDEAAFIFDCGRTKLTDAIRDGKLTAGRNGASTRLAHSELVRWNGGIDPLIEFEISQVQRRRFLEYLEVHGAAPGQTGQQDAPQTTKDRRDGDSPQIAEFNNPII